MLLKFLIFNMKESILVAILNHDRRKKSVFNYGIILSIKLLVVRTKSSNIIYRLVLNTCLCVWFNSLVWQWKCRSIYSSFLPNPVFALHNKMILMALVFKAQSSRLGVHCGSIYWFFLPPLKRDNLL